MKNELNLSLNFFLCFYATPQTMWYIFVFLCVHVVKGVGLQIGIYCKRIIPYCLLNSLSFKQIFPFSFISKLCKDDTTTTQALFNSIRSLILTCFLINLIWKLLMHLSLISFSIHFIAFVIIQIATYLYCINDCHNHKYVGMYSLVGNMYAWIATSW